MTTLIQTLYNEMVKYGEENADQAFTPPQLTSIVRKFVGNPDINVTTKRSTQVDVNQPIVGGYYDPNDDEDDFTSIFVTVLFNPEQKEIYIKDFDWADFCVDVIECVGHEVIHQEQYRRRNFDIRPDMFVSMNEDRYIREEQEYLGNLDEVEAYGYSLAVQIYLRRNPRSITGKHIHIMPMFQTYALLFGVQHPVVKSLVTHTVQYFKEIKKLPHLKKTKVTEQ